MPIASLKQESSASATGSPPGVPDVAVFSTQSHVSQFARGEQLDEDLVID